MSPVSTAPMPELTEEDLLFDLDLRAVPLDPSADEPSLASAVHTSYVTELCSQYPVCTYGCSYTCRGHHAAANDQKMCL